MSNIFNILRLIQNNFNRSNYRHQRCTIFLISVVVVLLVMVVIHPPFAEFSFGYSATVISVDLVENVLASVPFSLFSESEMLQCLLELVFVQRTAAIPIVFTENSASVNELLLLKLTNSVREHKWLLRAVRSSILVSASDKQR